MTTGLTNFVPRPIATPSEVSARANYLMLWCFWLDTGAFLGERPLFIVSSLYTFR